MDMPVAMLSDAPRLPGVIEGWFARKGWAPRAYQLEVLANSATHAAQLVIAPPGAGKTLAAFLPIMVAAASGTLGAGLRCLYVSPLKALAVDIRRALEQPIEAMRLPLSVEARTGDTPSARRARQFRNPPAILVTTPEQLALMLTSPEAARLFADLDQIILDEVHAVAPNKRGDLLALDLAHLATIAPQARRIALSATVADEAMLLAWAASGQEDDAPRTLVRAPAGAPPVFEVMQTSRRIPWSGHSARYAVEEIYQRLRAARLAIVFVNTRLQAELMFQMLWEINDDNLRIALHHGSLDRAHRRRVEAAMAEGGLDAVVATSTLDLGIDWGDVDLVIQAGAPKGASRLLQRVGRSRHRLDVPSQAVLVPSNRFEWLESLAGIEAAQRGEQDEVPPHAGALDVLAQHLISRLGAGPMPEAMLLDEVRRAYPYRMLTRRDFADVLAFVTNGGYALNAYERFARVRRDKEGALRLANPRVLQAHRLNIGTIADAPVVKVRIARGRGEAIGKGREIGALDSLFAATLKPGDSFFLGGEAWQLRGQREDEVLVSRVRADAGTQVPSYLGGRLPVSDNLAGRVLDMLSHPEAHDLPEQVRGWIALQRERARMPRAGRLLIETFTWRKRHYLALYPFAGRLANQTLGALLSRRMERAGLAPAGFSANDYALILWHLRPAPGEEAFFDALLSPEMLGEDLDLWLEETSILKRAFRACAVVSGLVPRRVPGAEKATRAITISADLIYDVLRRHEPDHVLLRAARAEAARELVDLDRLARCLIDVAGRVDLMHLDGPSPLSVPLLLEIGREKIAGEARDLALEDLGALDDEEARQVRRMLDA